MDQGGDDVADSDYSTADPGSQFPRSGVFDHKVEHMHKSKRLLQFSTIHLCKKAIEPAECICMCTADQHEVLPVNCFELAR